MKPTVPIKPMLERDGYPFKSKEHSLNLSEYQRMGEKSACYKRYLYPDKKRERYKCPQCLLYQFNPDFNLKVSRKCCDRLKKEPIKKWMKKNNIDFTITGMTRFEGGSRNNIKCFDINRKKFHPLAPITKDWEEWFIEEYHINICPIYREPYNFPRTGCKGCPFALDLQKELDTLEKFFPNERKQCELIWKPVYDEYRRLGYRLRKPETEHQMTIEEWGKGRRNG